MRQFPSAYALPTTFTYLGQSVVNLRRSRTGSAAGSELPSENVCVTSQSASRDINGNLHSDVTHQLRCGP